MSGPQVVEGWYGRPANKPLARTREYVEIVRRVLRREEPLDFQGEFFQHPYHGPDATGLGKPLKAITHPLRADLPIYLGAEGPKNVAMAAEIADGWLPLYYSPLHQDVYADSLKDAKPGFDIVAGAQVNINDDVEAALAPVKMMLGFYIGGMGAKGQNYHTKLMGRFGYEEEALKIQDAFFEGRRDEAIAMVPDDFADAISLCGPQGAHQRPAAGLGRQPGVDPARVLPRPRRSPHHRRARAVALAQGAQLCIASTTQPPGKADSTATRSMRPSS